MAFCLPKFAADVLRGKLKSGEITPDKLSDMSSAERRATFQFLGEENAKQVNALFEGKLLLKNQQAGMINWAKQILKLKPEQLRDTLSKVEKMTEVLSEKELDKFLEDLVEKKLGIDVSIQEAGKLVDLAKKVEESKAQIDRSSANGSISRLEYGWNLRMFQKYVEDLKIKTDTLTFKEYLKIKNWGKGIYDLAATSKSLLSTLDNSFFGRQGIKVLFTNPDIWWNGFRKSWGDIGKELKGIDAVDAIKAEIYSRENALNGNYKRMQVALGMLKEEAFPSALLTRIPFIGRVFKGAEAAYNGGALRLRADLADRFINQATKNGIDITDPFEAKSIGKIINSLTGRGEIGRAEVLGKEINAALFSIKFLKSNFDTLTAHSVNYLRGGTSKYAATIAAKNLIKIIATTGGILAIAEGLWPGSVEKDPRSSDFGKIRIGDTRFDVTGGMSSLAVLARRVVPALWGQGETKSSTTGRITKLGEDRFGAMNAMDVLYQFAEGKTSPALKAVIDKLNNKDFQGNVPTLESTLTNLVKPLPISTFQELMNNPNSADIMWSMIASELGIGVNTYSKNKK